MRTVILNPPRRRRKRRSRRRNPCRYHRRKRRNRYGHRARRYRRGMSYNPRRIGGVTAGFRPGNIATVLPVVGGMIANEAVLRVVSTRVPASLTAGIPRATLGVATAGILAGLVALLRPSWAAPMLAGGSAHALVPILQGVIPQAAPSPSKETAQMPAPSGTADFLVQPQIDAARVIS